MERIDQYMRTILATLIDNQKSPVQYPRILYPLIKMQYKWIWAILLLSLDKNYDAITLA